MNDLEIIASQFEVVKMMLSVAEGSLDEDGIVEWLHVHTEPFLEEE